MCLFYCNVAISGPWSTGRDWAERGAPRSTGAWPLLPKYPPGAGIRGSGPSRPSVLQPPKLLGCSLTPTVLLALTLCKEIRGGCGLLTASPRQGPPNASLRPACGHRHGCMTITFTQQNQKIQSIPYHQNPFTTLCTCTLLVHR